MDQRKRLDPALDWTLMPRGFTRFGWEREAAHTLLENDIVFLFQDWDLSCVKKASVMQKITAIPALEAFLTNALLPNATHATEMV
ncbi:hypothetical protein PMIN03_007302 [Paraphaeosphaeria minitans]